MLPPTTYAMMPWPVTWGGASYETCGANCVSVIKIYIPATITVSYIVLGVYVQVQGEYYGVGLYTLGGNLLFQSGAILAPSTTIHQAYVKNFTPVTIGAGMYWLGLSTSGALSTFEPTATPALVTILINEANRLIIGAATNLSVNGVMPATLGTVNPVAVPGSSLYTIIKLGS